MPTTKLEFLRARRGVLARLLVVFLALLTLETGFWFSADFRTFFPPCDGPFVERLYFASITAAGPFVMAAINGWSLVGWMIALVPLAVVTVLFAFGVWDRDARPRRLTAYIAVVLWFLIGFIGATLRIT